MLQKKLSKIFLKGLQNFNLKRISFLQAGNRIWI